ncbi:hypothetical protein WH95_13120 [Kiloniella litopenaei]|uniref:Uncharacterized protein n=1 Tax=Kiloniella litopenaei TaxID=1549748 RepID=A0A0M2R7N0_9PROT|nr:hypothetical protein WH95_13120 [Kiloniella litopenaei]
MSAFGETQRVELLKFGESLDRKIMPIPSQAQNLKKIWEGVETRRAAPTTRISELDLVMVKG